MAIFDHEEYRQHEYVSFIHDRETGLRAIIAVHTSKAGRAAGGIRMMPYENDDAALRDVLRLSYGMSLKFAMADIPFGGAKSVIIGDPDRDKTEALIRAYARFVDRLDGYLICSTDMGTTVEDLLIIRQETEHVKGLPGESGSTSPPTAWGVYLAMKASVKFKLGRDTMAGLSVAIQGCGGVGHNLCKHLHDDGVKLFVSDINAAAADRAVAEFGATAVAVNEIVELDVDILAPCAIGGILNDITIPKIKARIICGGANNQLLKPDHGRALAERGILYAPDYVVNSGGAINGSREGPGYDESESYEAIARIYDRCLEIFQRAEAEGQPPNMIADRMATEILARR